MLSRMGEARCLVLFCFPCSCQGFCLKPFRGNIPHRMAGKSKIKSVDLVVLLSTGLMLEKLSTPLVPFRSTEMHLSRPCYCEISCLFNIDLIKVSVIKKLFD